MELVSLIRNFLDSAEYFMSTLPEKVEEQPDPFAILDKKGERIVRFMPQSSCLEELVFSVEGINLVPEATLVGSEEIELECAFLL